MRFDILTLFPAMFTGPFTESILKRAQQSGHLEIALHDIRHYARDRHKSADDYPFGGGAGMVMKPEVVYQALADVLGYGEQALADLETLIPPPPDRPPKEMQREPGFLEHVYEIRDLMDTLVASTRAGDD